MTSQANAPMGAGAWSMLKHPLAPWLVDALHAQDFRSMTPVQAASINALLCHKDAIVEAPTGSGKTLAYLLPMLTMLEASGQLQNTPSTSEDVQRVFAATASTSSHVKSKLVGLVICPTRELAAQVHRVLVDLLAFRSSLQDQSDGPDEASETHIEGQTKQEEQQEPTEAEVKDRLSTQSQYGALLVVGGASRSEDDYRRFRNDACRIVVGTPGRVLELVERKTVDTKSLELVVLDEGDRLMDAGFSHDVEGILNYLPKQRRSALFSATMTDAITRLASLGLRNPARIVVTVKSSNASNGGGQSRAPAALSNFYTVSEPHARLWDFVNLLRLETIEDASGHDASARKVIVYFATCAQVDYFYKVLRDLDHLRGLQLYSLHGQQTPSRRSATFEAFVKSNPIGLAGRSLEDLDAPEAQSGEVRKSRSKKKKRSLAAVLQVPIASVLMCTDVAARGLDLPDVDLVIQFDAPTDPKVYAHRAGRTARAGKAGRAVVMLEAGRPEEFPLVMAVRKLPMERYPRLLPLKLPPASHVSAPTSQALPDAESLSAAIRSMCLSDREIYELSVRAFVSFVRAYSKHELSYVFRAKDMDLGAVAKCFGLIRMPKMPEVQDDLKRREAAALESDEAERADLWGFKEAEVDLKTWAYSDPQREAQRLESLASKEAKVRAERQAAELAGNAKRDSSLSKRKRMRGAEVQENAWSKQKEAKAVKEERKSKKARKREYIKRTALEQDQAERGEKEGQERSDDELDWLAEENEEKRKLRKARKEQQLLALRPPEERVEVEEAGFFDGL
ncbi:P-loop containing nucleoside triphosphate hydrolase protein [Ceraceosorus guamensis]|uniref:ATP-dependent RNA helicase n=1 Tax=Ceraceosorus guamensis TaxID=1522189 RepID=A0A316W1I0_9BASI|nr:P-loop containing nucleoside triphosphate hydrolase protein [Ceraceosorus guamensis]PWN42613.1 P-loop containing nucleoside triphosphate hydrolase protein [Ceraceosorus guamensis]